MDSSLIPHPSLLHFPAVLSLLSLDCIELKARRFFAVADKQLAVRHDRMIPRLAGKGLESAELLVTAGNGFDQGDKPRFRKHQEEILVGQKQHLPIAIATCFPLSLAVFQVDTSEELSIEAIEVLPLYHGV